MSQEKPEDNTSTKPAEGGLEAAENKENPTANPATDLFENLDKAQLDYLKGLSVTEINQETLARIINSGIKQKDSVSKMSQEVESYKIRLESMGKPQEQEEETTPQQTAPEQAPVAPVQQPSIVEDHIISEDDLFEFSRMIKMDFPALVEDATNGELFKELRQLGYFGVGGIKKKAAYEYLSRKNEQLTELNELREFKKKASEPNQGVAPSYQPRQQLRANDKMTEEAARAIIAQSINERRDDIPRLAEARQFLQRKAANL